MVCTSICRGVCPHGDGVQAFFCNGICPRSMYKQIFVYNGSLLHRVVVSSNSCPPERGVQPRDPQNPAGEITTLTTNIGKRSDMGLFLQTKLEHDRADGGKEFELAEARMELDHMRSELKQQQVRARIMSTTFLFYNIITYRNSSSVAVLFTPRILHRPCFLHFFLV